MEIRIKRIPRQHNKLRSLLNTKLFGIFGLDSSESKMLVIALALIVAGVTLRLVPHAANFAPVGAIALFGGAVLSTRLALWLPLLVMILSDLVIGLHGTIAFTWGGFVLVALFGMTLKNRSNLSRIPVGALGSAIIFYIVSNFGVWVEGKLYPHTMQGLLDCFAMALPFLRTSLLADLLFSAALFGAYALALRSFKATNPVLVKR